MNRSEMKEVSSQLQELPPFILRMIVMHPNQAAELAANELLVREVKKNHDGN